MSDEMDGGPAIQLFIPQVRSPAELLMSLNAVVGMNVRVKAHSLWHQIMANSELHPTERTIGFVKVQAFLDYADEVDPDNRSTSDALLQHFGWKFPVEPTDEKDAQNGSH